MKDWKLIGSLILACCLISITFDYKHQVFWYLYTATMLFLISITIIAEKTEDKISIKQAIFWGIPSGILLYVLFSFGKWLLSFIPVNALNQITKLYEYFSLEWLWQYLLLIFVIIPGEEFFWRGFVLKRILRYIHPTAAVIIGASLNALAFCLTGYLLLILAAFFSGLVWGILYVWKRSLPLLIISHLIFDLLLFVLFPLA
ncbi:CPBP family intramembrane metalloprotease [Lederbergia sp. NSJ-179]|uniref:CPBP family intramembrane glutamic endopeptidase n=1 Tax=Lederbergia sp. NSJ-179 TaxID=2931402 RepID=UPI001FD15E62|nr:CPBP family intramembrane glutamic endopeptidase [Lederbergia sp. NSJ-179]MCJ7841717.1 CPBP family intramembrane metalloprotease [Lederbergia sp. NSJ-179]